MLIYSTVNNKTKIYSEYLEDTIYNLLDKTFILPRNFDFNIFEVTEEYETITEYSELNKTNLFNNLDAVYQEGIVATYNSKIVSETKVAELKDAKAPAWSYFNVKAIATIATTDWTVSTEASQEVVATFSTTGTSGIVFELIEFGNPGHAGHYGHGSNSHGNNQNAGGGISWAE